MYVYILHICVCVFVAVHVCSVLAYFCTCSCVFVWHHIHWFIYYICIYMCVFVCVCVFVNIKHKPTHILIITPKHILTQYHICAHNFTLCM